MYYKRYSQVINNFRKNTEAVAAIEFALVLPVLALLLLFLWDISHYASEKMRLEQSIRAVASAVVNDIDDPNFTSLSNAVIDEFYSGVGEVQPVLTVTSRCECAGVNGSCYGVCSSGSAPERIVTISAQIPVDGPISGIRDATSSIDIKIR